MVGGEKEVDLLAHVATELWHAAQERIPQLLSGHARSGDVVDRLMLAQPARTCQEFQLPEPMMGSSTSCRVLVVGLNPGLDEAEEIPRLDWPLERYVGWYSRRFVSDFRDDRGRPIKLTGGQRKVIQHYVAVERLLPKGVGADQIGRGVAYADAVPWKSRKGPAPEPEILALASERVQRMVEALAPRLVITLGTIPATIFQAQPGKPVTVQPWALGAWRGSGIAAYHPNAQVFVGSGSKKEYEQRVAQQAAEVLG